PLTLAYVGLMLWPFHLLLLCQDLRKKSRYLLVISNLALLYFSASRTAQAVALIVSVGYLFYTFRGRNRLIVAGSLALCLAGVFGTDNNVSRRFKSMGTQISEEKESPYRDDRIAFWIVHYIMVKERPMTGHGINLDKAYRVPYYDRIGLPNFKKAYEAHNQLLQLAAEGGLAAMFAFIAWMGTVHFNWKQAPRYVHDIRDLTIICLFLGGLTQNAYMDGEVRFALLTLMSLAFAAGFGQREPT
ncbi:MAG: O-antigen ligase domain-containing protein, partial [Proteobacteria bacterium]